MVLRPWRASRIIVCLHSFQAAVWSSRSPSALSRALSRSGSSLAAVAAPPLAPPRVLFSTGNTGDRSVASDCPVVFFRRVFRYRLDGNTLRLMRGSGAPCGVGGAEIIRFVPPPYRCTSS